MPNKRTPTLEEAKALFNRYPQKLLREWADEWNCSAERVRQLRHECGIGAVFSIDYDVVEKVAERIENNIYTLTETTMYEDLPVGRDAFATWIRDDIDVAQRIHEAKELGKARKLDPVEKKCMLCLEVKSVSHFDRTQKYADGFNKFCKVCIENIKNKEPKEQKKKTCFMCKKSLSPGSFDAKSAFCKRCRSKNRRAKRARNLKTQ